jgi:hypothetical protein
MRNANQRMLLWSVFTVLAATLPGTGTIWAATATPPQIASASQIFTTNRHGDGLVQYRDEFRRGVRNPTV